MLLTLILVFLISYHVHGLGVTIGYHRLLAHHSIRCKKFVEYFLVMAGYLAFQGCPIFWTAIHRSHHRYSETPLDPHSPREGMKWSYIGWLLKPPAYLDQRSTCRDLFKDPLYRFLDRGDDLCSLICNVGFRLILWFFFGWQIALTNLIAAIAVFQVPMFLNTFCHIPALGYKTYDTRDDSVNVWWVGYLANGEGWHNNHHAFPGSARHGLKTFEFDFSYCVIQLLHAVGLVTRVNLPAPHLIKGLQAPKTGLTTSESATDLDQQIIVLNEESAEEVGAVAGRR